jgi:hypothetical protein
MWLGVQAGVRAYYARCTGQSTGVIPRRTTGLSTGVIGSLYGPVYGRIGPLCGAVYEHKWPGVRSGVWA